MTQRGLLTAMVAAGAVWGCAFDQSGATQDGPGKQVDAAVEDAVASQPDARPPVDARPSVDARPPVDARLPADAAPPDAMDGDHDGVADQDDNCVAIANPQQYDEDEDGFGDVCDNCPSISNPGQEDDGESEVGVDPDGVGDACDPRADVPGDSILFFDGFNDELLAGHWSQSSDLDCGWQVSGGVLSQTSLGSCRLYWNGASVHRVVLDTRATVDTLASGDGVRNLLGVFGQYDPGEGTGYTCLCYDDPAYAELNYWILIEFQSGPDSGLESVEIADLVEGSPYTMRMAVSSDADLAGDPIYQMCALRQPLASEATVLYGYSESYSSGYLGLRTEGVAASLPFVIVYELGPYVE